MEIKLTGPVAVLALVLIVALGGYAWFSPTLTANKIRDAAQKGDTVALARYVDLPAVRRKLESAYSRQMLKEMQAQGTSALKPQSIRAIADRLSSPEGLARIMAGVVPDETGGLKGPKHTLHRRFGGSRRFFLSTWPAGGQGGMTLEFRRSGLLGWTLIEVQLPF